MLFPLFHLNQSVEELFSTFEVIILCSCKAVSRCVGEKKKYIILFCLQTLDCWHVAGGHFKTKEEERLIALASSSYIVRFVGRLFQLQHAVLN